MVFGETGGERSGDRQKDPGGLILLEHIVREDCTEKSRWE